MKRNFRKYLYRIRETWLGWLLLGLLFGVGSVLPLWADDAAESDSLTDYWERISDAAVEFGKEVGQASAEFGTEVGKQSAEYGKELGQRSAEYGKEIGQRSAEFGREVSDKAVAAWERVTSDTDSSDVGADSSFGDVNMGVEEVTEATPEDSFATKAERSAVELWARVAEAFAQGDSGEEGYPSRTQLWNEVHGDLAEAARRQSQNLPEVSASGASQGANRKEIDELLRRILVSLEVSGIARGRKEYAALEEEVSSKRADIIRLREKMVVAPEQVEGVDRLWSSTVRDYQEQIAALEQEIGSLQVRQNEILNSIQGELLKRSGVKLSADQVYSLVVLVTGESFITLHSVVYNTRQLFDLLEQLARENMEDIGSVRRYYGMYLVLLQVLELAHDQEIARIEGEYLPRLEEYQVQVDIASQDTRKLIMAIKGDESSVTLLNTNLQAQAELYAACRVYIAYLREYLLALHSGREQIQRQLFILEYASNIAYLPSGFVSMMQNSTRVLHDLSSLELPSLKEGGIGRVKAALSLLSFQINE